ncbi:hypothetical protein AG1IA_08750 [Rhizoctonia solani AG-1 IA]|uniref:Uncharacterized protein n=1 Tax=Thanatephorus cucumeris (strain AG1-IA) TaxID=983506 RepID=L8WH19_THACA|nr:hypothetical protein AG1IA_08750 [Rhizoctonia solani AG-1 IA]
MPSGMNHMEDRSSGVGRSEPSCGAATLVKDIIRLEIVKWRYTTTTTSSL